MIENLTNPTNHTNNGVSRGGNYHSQTITEGFYWIGFYDREAERPKAEKKKLGETLLLTLICHSKKKPWFVKMNYYSNIL